MKIPIRAAQNRQRGRMRPAGRQFDMPAIRHRQESKTQLQYMPYFQFMS